MNDLFNVLIKPLATEKDRFVFGFLIDAFSRECATPKLTDLFRTQSAVAFQSYTESPELVEKMVQTTQILTRPFSELSKEQRVLVFRCIPFLEKKYLGPLFEEIESCHATLDLLTHLPITSSPERVERYIRLNISESLDTTRQKRLSGALIRFASILSAALCRDAVDRLFSIARKQDPSFHPALEPLAHLFPRLPEEDIDFRNTVIDTLITCWAEGRSDRYTSAVAETIHHILPLHDLALPIAEKLLVRCQETLNGTTGYTETRRRAYDVIEEIARRYPETFLDRIDSLIDRMLTDSRVLTTIDLCRFGKIMYHLLTASIETVFRRMIAIVKCAERIGIGAYAWRNLVAVSNGSLRRFLETEKLRPTIFEELGDLPDRFQKTILYIGQLNHDEELFEKTNPSSLGKRARQQFEKWALAKSQCSR